MIHPEDYRLILAMLGVSEMPDGLEDEYTLRLSMFHRAGHQGPLGAIGLISLIRDAKLSPTQAAVQAERIDWSRYPVNGRVRVEARTPLAPKDWLLGVYNGMSGPGELAIKLDGDPYVRTFLARDVRLALDQSPPKADDSHDMMSYSGDLEAQPTADQTMPPAVESVIDTDIDDESDGSEPDDELIGNDEPTDFIPVSRSRSQGKRTPQIVCDEPDPLEQVQSFDWSSMPVGSSVWVQDEEIGILEGKLVAVSGDKLALHIDGEDQPRDFDCEICTLGG